MRSMSPLFGPLRTRVPTERSAGSALHCELAGIELQRRRGYADELKARMGEDRDLIAVVRDDVDVHQLRELIDVAVALVEQVRGGRVVGGGGAELLVDLGDALHRLVGLADRIGEPEFGIAAQALDVG